jgi:8-amino-7-oxononanoate synthase
MAMPDFTSVLYLGMTHAHDILQPWRRLTTGRPVALEPSARGERLAERLALFMGHEAAALGASTLHLFWDLFASLASNGIVIHVDAGTYPIARWGIERVAAQGVRVVPFGQHDVGALLANLFCTIGRGFPVIVADGLCPIMGRPAPLDDYARLCRAFGGLLVVDDTQGIGLFGNRPSAAAPYGLDGAGTPAWCAARSPDLLVVSSLAKAFGAPLAVIAGGGAWIERFKVSGQTRVHCSPPSMAAISAAEHALVVNAVDGQARRSRLLALIGLFRSGLERLGLAAHGELFPFQTLKQPTGNAATELHARLSLAGVRTVLHRATQSELALVTFVINCLHTPLDIARALDALDQCKLQGARIRLAS